MDATRRSTELPFEGNDAAENPTETSLNTLIVEDETQEPTEPTTQISFRPISRKEQDLIEEPVPLFRVLRDFLFQTRDVILDPSATINERPMDEKTEKIVKLIEHGLIEASTILASQVANIPLSTPSSGITVDNSLNRQNDIFIENTPEKLSPNVMLTKNKRQTTFNLIVNASTSCSSCYNRLQKCVQQCFNEHNCNDIQRDARAPPPPLNRLCNPFTPWNPVDECKNHRMQKSAAVLQ
ncbi:WAP domain-containing protein [Caerostris extrusa]|uniref:WAP domain-containing protein n=1 Tax=Caerostris extrusa TaxID=172846 RepID=A0AAV4TY06_CAEEX|nr:WAP domain-containing protein [Caerostris extrusa]